MPIAHGLSPAACLSASDNQETMDAFAEKKGEYGTTALEAVIADEACG